MKRSMAKVVVVALATGFAFIAGRTTAKEEEKTQVYELRTYTTHEGKLEDLHKRFRDHTNRLFVKHGMRLVGYWTPMDEPASENTLIYILAHDSREAAQKSFEAFRADPEWKEAYAKSHENGPIVEKVVSTFLTPTDYSPLK